jgi:hypothetical protein
MQYTIIYSLEQNNFAKFGNSGNVDVTFLEKKKN